MFMFPLKNLARKGLIAFIAFSLQETVLSTSFRDGVKLLLLAGAVCAGLLLIKRQLTW